MANELHREVPTAEAEDKREYVYVRYEDDDDEMDIYDIIDLCKKGLLVLKRYLALLLVFFVIGGVLGFGKAKAAQHDSYSSTALLFVDLNREAGSTSDSVDESSRISMLARSFSEIVRSESVVAPIAKAEGTDTTALSGSIDVTVPDGTQTIKVTVTADDAQRAQAVCTDIINSGIAAMDNATSYASISVVSPASEAVKAPTESAAKSAVTMAAVFLILALLIVVVRELGAAYKAHKADESKK